MMFGRNSLLNLPFQVAAKTGTTNGWKDNWTMGYTPQVTVGVWVGNTDNESMENATGLDGAAPIWNAVMRYYLQDKPPVWYDMPPGITISENSRSTRSSLAITFKHSAAFITAVTR